MKNVLALALSMALLGCAATTEEPPMTDDPRKPIQEALERIRAMARDVLVRVQAESSQVDNVSDELVRLATPKVVALRGTPGTPEHRSAEAKRIFRETLDGLRDDPQRAPEFRAAAARLAETMADRLKPI